jgi:hypothetical protein
VGTVARRLTSREDAGTTHATGPSWREIRKPSAQVCPPKVQEGWKAARPTEPPGCSVNLGRNDEPRRAEWHMPVTTVLIGRAATSAASKLRRVRAKNVQKFGGEAASPQVTAWAASFWKSVGLCLRRFESAPATQREGPLMTWVFAGRGPFVVVRLHPARSGGLPRPRSPSLRRGRRPPLRPRARRPRRAAPQGGGAVR